MLFDLGQFLLEIPFVMIITFLFYKSFHENVKYKVLIASIPWMLFYFFIDLYHILFGRVFKWVEVTELPELIDILPLYYLIFSGLIYTSVIFIFIRSVNFNKSYWAALGVIPVLVTMLWANLLPSNFYTAFVAIPTKTFDHQDLRTVSSNGRWFSLLYFEAKRKNAITQLKFDETWLVNKELSEKNIIGQVQKRNVHVIVMESFLDPTLLGNVDLPDNIMPQSIKQLEPFKNLSRSPVFGNRTPQAEFEILCNVPALQKLGNIEFNLFSGSGTSCLPSWLKNSGWHTVATHAYKPTFFNRANAYRSLQFDDVFFAKDYVPASNTYFETKLNNKARFMFDGDLFEQNLAFLKEYKKTQTKPIFNYILGVYGHWPNERDLEKYPDVFQLEGFESMARVVNEYYYRTYALEKYLDELKAIDPDAIIVVISDHLPPMKNMRTVYKDLDYLPKYKNDLFLNVYYLFDKGEPVKMQEIVNHYDFASIIKNRLLNTQCEKSQCLHQRNKEELLQQYINVMSWAIQ